jgi:hypothetical protein
MATRKQLATGTASTTLTEIYPIPVGNTATLSRLLLTDRTANSISVSLYYNDGTSDILIRARPTQGGIGKTLDFDVANLTFSEGQSLKLQAATANAVDFILTGFVST